MTEGFSNSVVGGQGALVRQQISSPNFNVANPLASPTPSWAILKNGLAYFFGLTLTGGTISGPDYTINTDGIFLYSGTPANGNLIGSWAGQAGTDAFGNTYPAGLTVSQGAVTGVLLTNSLITSSAMQGGTITGATITSPTINGGSATEIAITFDNNGGVLLVYATSTTTVTQTVAGTYTFTGPANVTQGSVQVQGAGAGGDGGSASTGGNGGGAGEDAQETQYPLVPASVYTYVVGAAGVGNSTGSGHGTNGSASQFDIGGIGLPGGVTANGGNGDGTPGTGSANSIAHPGGSGGSGSTSGGAGGGGGSAGSTGAGGNAANASTSSGTAGGTAGTGGGAAGGAGGNNAANGSNGSSPGAGGGGAGKGSSTGGSLTKTYNLRWGGGYFGPDSDAGAPPNGLRSSTTFFQGGETAGGGGFNGNMRSILNFNAATIQSDFSGYTITNAVLTITNQHSWYNSGMTVELGYGTTRAGASRLSSYPGWSVTHIADGGVAEGGTAHFGLGSSVGSQFASNSIDSIVLGANVASQHPYNLNYYGYFGGTPTLTVYGTKTSAGSFTAGNGADGKVSITYATATALLATIAPAAGTDAHGNAYNAGIWVYGSNGSAVGMIPSGSNTALAFVPGVTPAAIAGTALMYGTTSGGVNLVDGGDAATYAVGRRTLVVASNTPIAASPGTSVFSTPGTIRSYRIHGQIYVTVSGAVQQLSIGIGLPSGTGHFGTILSRAAVLVATTDFANNALTALGAVGSLAVGNTYVCLLDGVANVTSGGNIVVTLAGTNANDLTVLANSFVEFEPV